MADRTVYFAKITRQPGLWDAPFGEWLLETLDPRGDVTRYRRTWRVSKPEQIDDRFLAGRFGFVQEAAAQETTYDEALQDFVTTEGTTSEGSFSNFVVDTHTEIVAFEERPPDIRAGSFLNNFRALITGPGSVTVQLLLDPAAWPAWTATLDRLVEVRAVVKDPNPGWNEDAGAIRELVEDSNAEEADVKVKSRDGESLEASATWITATISQVAEHGQGSVLAIGVRGEDKVRWRSGESRRTATMPEAVAAVPRGPWEWMRRRLRDFYDRH